jgi:hypothetical protein
MNISLKKQLKRYSALSSTTIALINTANSQVVETFVGQEINLYDDSYGVDLDGNGVIDFQIIHTPLGCSVCMDSGGFVLDLKGEFSNQLIGYPYNYYLFWGTPVTVDNASKLSTSYIIDSSKQFLTSGRIVIDGYTMNSSFIRGAWKDYDTCDGYLGVKLDINGNSHFGWIRIVVGEYSKIYISSWAYETQPDTPIVTPDVTNKSATNVVATDFGNNGAASDIQITFAKAIDEYDLQSQGKYKLFLSKNATPPDVASNTYFHEVTMDGSANYTVNLPSNFLDVDGTAIETNTLYYVYVFAVYSCEEYISDEETISINDVVGVKDTSAMLRMSVYPNPTSGVMEIISDEVLERVEITDLTGKAILNYELSVK